MDNITSILGQRPSPDTTPEHITLMREFFRRMALWTEKLSCPEEFPLGDLTRHVSIPVDEAKVATWLAMAVDRRSSMMDTTIRHWLRWRALEEPVPNPEGLPDPYAPFEAFLNAGGWFRVDQGNHMEFWMGGLSMGGRLKYLDMPTIWEAQV